MGKIKFKDKKIRVVSHKSHRMSDFVLKLASHMSFSLKDSTERVLISMLYWLPRHANHNGSKSFYLKMTCLFSNQSKDHNKANFKNQWQTARHWWLMPVILATQEAEIRRIKVWSQPRQIVQETLSWKTLHKKGLVEWLKV
jgi:hypothetical protein